MSVITTEEWRPVVGYEGRYSVSDQGRVYSHLSGKILAPVVDRGYLRISLRINGTFRKWRAHQLVAAAFIGPRPPGMEVRHLDGNKMNCAPANLTYGTRSENMKDKGRHGQDPNLNKTHCPQGHPYDDANTWRGDGRRHCLACNRERSRRYRKDRKS